VVSPPLAILRYIGRIGAAYLTITTTMLASSTTHPVPAAARASRPLVLSAADRSPNQLPAGLPALRDWAGVGDKSDTGPVLSADDQAGFSVAISGNTAVVGAPGMAKDAGTAYIYEREGERWRREATLPDPRGAPHDDYAWAVAISDAGTRTYVAVGGNDTNGDPDRVYIYEGSGKRWHREATLDDPGGHSKDMYGESMAISGTTLVVSAPCIDDNMGDIYIYERFGQQWTMQAAETDPAAKPDDLFGRSASTSGNRVLVGAVDVAYVYTNTRKFGWQLTAVLHNPGTKKDNFGTGAYLEGSTAVIGAPGGVQGTPIDSPLSSGATYIFTMTGKTWSKPEKLTPPAGAQGDEFGYAVAATSKNLVIGMPLYGKVSCGTSFVYVLSGRKWLERRQLLNRNCTQGDAFGFSVALSASTGVIGAPNAENGKGAAYFRSL
jgi:hypothetical protein